MNAKAERIEQIIQVVNRNLQLIYSGQQDGVTPLDARPIQKIDTSSFGNDKFAYEMLHFVKLNSKSIVNDSSSISAIWDRNFLKGLETLLVECAVVRDDIERDCFVSRVYLWFTEKALERRDLPRSKIDLQHLNVLKSSIQTIGGTHTVKALDKYISDATGQVPSRSQFIEDEHPLHNLEIPSENNPSSGQARSKTTPLYIRHAYPSLNFDKTVLPPPISNRSPLKSPEKISRNDHSSPEKTGRYDHLYGSSEIEAEKGVHALFVAKQRQEAFEWKAKQQLALVLDRRALHMSRLECDELRRTESGYVISQAPKELRQSSKQLLTKFAPEVKRPFSAKRRGAARALQTWPDGNNNNNNNDGSDSESSYASQSYRRQSASPAGSPWRSGRGGNQNALTPHSTSSFDNLESSDRGEEAIQHDDDSNILIKLSSNGLETGVAAVSKASRNAVSRNEVRRSSVEKDGSPHFVPMKFRNKLPDGYAQRTDKQRSYLQDNSDSDEEKEKSGKLTESSKKEGIASMSTSNRHSLHSLTGNTANTTSDAVAMVTSASGHGANRSPSTGGVGGRKVILKKIEKVVVKERPQSAVCMKEIAAHDPELMVHYRFSNFRRMPVTPNIEKWMDEKDLLRRKKIQDFLVELRGATKLKSKGKGSSRSGSASKSRPTSSTSAGATGRPRSGNNNSSNTSNKGSSKYKSADHFMWTHFPSFDRDSQGPLRTVQLTECEHIKDVFKASNMEIQETALQKALVIPQDRPELVCAENLKGHDEGLLKNPIPKEFWRKTATSKDGKKAKKTSRRKKKTK